MKTLKEWAELINGRQYREELTRAEEKELKEQGFVVVFGASDDLMEFSGAINDEFGCYTSYTVYIANGKIFTETCNCRKCEIILCLQKQCDTVTGNASSDDCAFKFTSTIPNEPFNIFDGENLYCKGLIFDIKSVKQPFELAEEDKNNLKPVKTEPNWTLKNQLAKIREEYSEVEILVLARELGYNDIDLTDIAEELVDLQTACETMLAMLGFDDAERNNIRLKVFEKNRKRGYYNE